LFAGDGSCTEKRGQIWTKQHETVEKWKTFVENSKNCRGDFVENKNCQEKGNLYIILDAGRPFPYFSASCNEQKKLSHQSPSRCI